jgi:16S rRNA processing protein RimM
MSQKTVDARLVGIVGKPHGVKGEVNVMLLTDYPGSILKGSILYLDQECTHNLKVKNIYIKKAKGREIAVILFDGVFTRNEAETLRGKELFRKGEDSPDLEEGEYWVDDLEGCSVYLEDGSLVGIVEKVEILPANENLLVKPEGGENPFFVPLVDDYISSVDISGKRIVLKKLPEYL